MQYTVTSGGRPIGVTDLGFVRCDATGRAGWFYPNAEGEALMETIAGPFAKEPGHLTLHREDGSVVPTELIGLQDTVRLLALADWDDDREDADERRFDDALNGAHNDGVDDAFDDGWELPDEFYAPADPGLDALEGDALGAALDASAEPMDPPLPWKPPLTDAERYQILVVLAVPNAIP